MKTLAFSAHRQTLWLVSLLAAGTGGLHTLPAQTAPPPKPPFVAQTAPERSRWTVDFQYATKPGTTTWPTADQLHGKRLVRQEITRTGDLKLTRSFYDGGGRQDVWTVAGLEVLKDPDYPHAIVRRTAGGRGDFPECFWIPDATFQGRERIGEQDCLVFQKHLYPLQFSNPGLYAAEMAQETPTIDLGSPVPVVAWIHNETHLPVKMNVGDDTRTYAFHPPPPTRLTIPTEYTDAISQVESRLQSLVQPLAKP